MSKVRVYEIAKQLNMDQKQLVALFQSMGIGDVRNHMSAVEVDAVERVKRHLERQKTPEVVEERIRPGVVKRRARAVEADAAPARAPSPPASSSVRGPVPAAAPSVQEAFEAAPTARAAEIPAAVPAAGVHEPGALRAPSGDGPTDAPRESEKAPVARRSSVGRSSARASRAGAGAPSVEQVDFDAEPPAPVSSERPVEPALPPAVVDTPPSSPRSSQRGRAAASQRGTIGAAAGGELASVAVGALEHGGEVAAFEAAVEAEPSPPTEVSAQAQAVDIDLSGGAGGEARRPSSPPRTGIDVWQGRPGVPMPQTRQTTPPARRTTYDPRATSAQQRPGAGSTFPGGRMGNRPGHRPGFGPRGRPGVGGPAAPKRPVVLTEMAAHKKVIKIEESVSLQKLASMMSLKVTDVLMKLLSMGMTGVNINSTIDSDTAKILASEFGWTVEDVAVSEEASLEAAMGGVEEAADGQVAPRPPIVTVMGHVDHGKTSLLDRIRKTSVASGEAGGITQHIGAYRVDTPKGTIAFLDTPGHEAFTSMRARGAQVTDIVVLVVAADDGVMPQTREAVVHAQSAKVPIIVAVNKIDKPTADPDKIKRDLSNLGLMPEEWGGETLYCNVSAVTGQGVEQLLDTIVLQAEVLELRASPKRRASGVVIEALLDRGRGPVARVMVQDGTLKTGDILIAGPAWGKVRAMTDELGRSLGHAGPSTPVEVLGLNEVPSAGDQVHAVKDAKTAEEIAEQRKKKANKSLIPPEQSISLEQLKERLAKGEQIELRLIVKGDVQGSVEAVVAALIKLSTAKVKVSVVHAAVGAITEGDVNLAIASKAIIVGFNVRPAGKANSLAETGGIEIRLYTIIYNAVDDIRSAMEGLLPTTKVEKALGAAEVRQVFKISKVGTVAGCYVTTGLVRRGAEARLVRDSIVVHTGKIGTLRRIKDDVKEVAEGLECGITLENYQDIKEGDVIEAFEIEEVKQKLA